jgi:hypothetical protein
MIERYVWHRDAEGGQIIRNLQMVAPFNRQWLNRWHHTAQSIEFLAYLDGRNLHSASGGAFVGFVSLISKDNGETWEVFRLREDVDDVRPEVAKFHLGWVRRVDDFNSQEAQHHIRTADSDLPPGTLRQQTELDLTIQAAR